MPKAVRLATAPISKGSRIGERRVRMDGYPRRLTMKPGTPGTTPIVFCFNTMLFATIDKPIAR